MDWLKFLGMTVSDLYLPAGVLDTELWLATNLPWNGHSILRSSAKKYWRGSLPVKKWCLHASSSCWERFPEKRKSDPYLIAKMDHREENDEQNELLVHWQQCCQLTNRKFMNSYVKSIFDFQYLYRVEILGFFCHSGFTWKQFLKSWSPKNCHLYLFAALNFGDFLNTKVWNSHRSKF